MNIRFVFCLLMVISKPLFANPDLLSVHIDLNDAAALQRGARTYMNYCSGCHTLRYMRYNQMAKGLGLTTFAGDIDTPLLTNNLIFTQAKPEDPIVNAMPIEDAREWFGRAPPDLTLSARERGPDWIYTYLKSFYIDTKRPFGANNAIYPDVGMPNVLSALQGEVIALRQAEVVDNKPPSLILVQQGKMTQPEFDQLLEDLVTFLTYVAEPARLQRQHVGGFVVIFLSIFALIAYKLKKIYWRRVK